jgi:tRNA pseudouridine55 synthase
MTAQYRRERRTVDGILLLDKPAGMTSNRALQRVRGCYRARKAGHTGSLDPLATGLLPVCLGEATKVSAYLLDGDKVYRTHARLGSVTDTGDADGEVLQRAPLPEGLDAAMVEAVLAGFRGAIEQVPPMYSALKHKGQRLHALARRGVSVERAARPVQIQRLELLGIDGEVLELEVACSKGTYVRTLVADIGAALGCGAHVLALRRTGLGPFGIGQSVPLARIEALADGDHAAEGFAALDALLLPVDAALAAWPAVSLSADASRFFGQGQAVWQAGLPAVGPVRVYGDGRFLGIGALLDDGRLAPRRVLAAEPV